MRILLFITSIYNTFEKIDGDEFKKILDKLDEIAQIEGDQKIIISFCDETENKNIFTYFFRNILDYIREKNIYLGNQFLGNVYYKDINNGGALLYEGDFCKESEVFKYVDSLKNQGNFINLYYVDGNINNNLLNEIFKDFGNDVEYTIIDEKENGKGILNSLYNISKRKKLIYEN
ncbi:MAG: hypothetical protein J6B64_00165 [Bacilli bacterium]|nr:hypothetical protein [Bacilli bacterium]MBP3635545.1 hypothetical protein [Bacilli bacterium]